MNGGGPMDAIELTEAEVWQVKAMAAEIDGLAVRLALARELQATALAAMVSRHGGDTVAVWRVSADGTKLERV